jgi:hypothetical protein
VPGRYDNSAFATANLARRRLNVFAMPEKTTSTNSTKLEDGLTSRSKYRIAIRRTAPPAVLALLLTVFLTTGFIGLDFGYHWDEMFALEEVSRPIESGVFLPRSYNYGSMIFDIGSILLLPRTIPFLATVAKDSRPQYVQPYQELVPKSRAAPLVAFATSKDFLLRMRGVFLVLTSLTGVWVFIAVRACKRSGWEAVFASAVILTSWEIAYHARWVAPDTIQMQFTALWLMFFALALHSGTRASLWLRLSAVAAGLGCGTKYQGAILLVPVIAYSVVRFSTPTTPGALRKAVKEILSNATVFAGVFVISTPGSVLDPLLFCQSLRHVSHQYATGHLGHTVGAVGQHGLLLLMYLTLVLMSHWPIASFMLAALACLGVFILWKERPTTMMLLLCAPVIYTLFMACHRVMFARNYLLLAPFIALFAAHGAFQVWNILYSVVWIRRGIVTCLILFFLANMTFLAFAAWTITLHRRPTGAAVAQYLKKHPNTRYLLSSTAAEAVAKENVTLSNTTRDSNAAQRYVFYSDEDDLWAKVSANWPGQYHRVSGPLDVNFDYYPGWRGAEKVLDLSIDRAREMHLFASP